MALLREMVSKIPVGLMPFALSLAVLAVLAVYSVTNLQTALFIFGFIPTAFFGMIVFVTLPGRIVLWAYLGTSIVLAGLVQFYGGISSAVWGASVMGMALFIWYFVRLGGMKQPVYIRFLGTTMVIWAIFTLANSVSPIGFFVASVSYFMSFVAVFGVAKILQKGSVNITDLEKALCFLPVLQLPFIFHQRFVLIRGTTNWDSIVGTFGGQIGGGGGNANMMMYMVAALAVALHLYQQGKISARYWWTIFTVVFVIIGLGETKAFFIFLPLVLIVQQFPRIRRYPAKAAVYGALLLGAIYGLSSVYEQFNYVARYGENHSVGTLERAQKSINYVLDPYNIDYETGEVGRFASLSLWAGHVANDPLGKWLGYGIGASRRSSIAPGAIALQYAPLKLGSTAMAQLLWDTGIIGTGMFLLTILAAVRSMIRSAKREVDSYISSRYRTIAALLLMLLLSMFYKAALIEAPAVKCLFVMLLAVGWATQQRLGLSRK
ncbi:MAG: hypothetical protein JKY31_10135 [Rhodobacteraceae bacterium]|nr:hypothetical protein [Paracoccaceae bacterium]